MEVVARKGKSSLSLSNCARIVYFADRDIFYSVMATPLAIRERLFPIYAFNIEIARIPWVTTNPDIAEIKLLWWYEFIENLSADTYCSHEVIEPLKSLIFKHNLPKNLFLKIIESRRFDIYCEPHSGVEAQKKYLRDTSGALMELALRILCKDPSDCSISFIKKIGFCFGVSSLISALPDLYAAQRQPLFCCKEGKCPSLIKTFRECATSREFALQELAETSIKLFYEARSQQTSVQDSALLAALPAFSCLKILKAARKSPKVILKQRFALSLLTKSFLLSKLVIIKKI